MKEIDFDWTWRYSKTDKPDKHGRWARLCYVNNLLIAWINYIEIEENYFAYNVMDFFPSTSNDNPRHIDVENDLDEAKTNVERRFINFLEKIYE